MDKYTRVRSW